MRSIHCGLSILALAAASAMPALAHHGWAGQGNEQVKVSGTVHQVVDLVNPHATLQVMADGQVWDITLAPPSRTRGAGLTPQTLAVGDEVTVQGNRNADQQRYEIKAVRITRDGKNFDLYPERVR